MNNMTRAALVLALLLEGLTAAACADRGSVTGPTSATRGVSAAISLSGVVYDTAHRLLSGARVEVIEGTVGDWCHYGNEPSAPACVLAAVTDELGRFRFSASAGNTTFASVTRLRASMAGYLSETLVVDSTTSNGAIEFRLEPSVTR